MGEFVEDHARASGRPLFGGASRDDDRRSRRGRSRRSAAPARASSRRTAASIAHFDTSDDALTFANSRWAADLCQMGTSCPGSFPADAHLSDVRAVESGARETSTGSQQRIGEQIGRYRDEYVAYYAILRAGRLAGAARFEPVGRRDSGARRLRFRQGQARSADHHGVLRQRRARDGRRHRARGERDPARRAAAGAAAGAGAASSRAFTTTSRCRGPRRSASSTGRSKRRSCSGCRRSASSAGRSRVVVRRRQRHRP